MILLLLKPVMTENRKIQYKRIDLKLDKYFDCEFNKITINKILKENHLLDYYHEFI